MSGPEHSRRSFLKSLAGFSVASWVQANQRALAADAANSQAHDGPKVIILLCGGIRQAETFHDASFTHIPRLGHDLLAKSLFAPDIFNAGVTSHFNTISSVLTGNWQRLDDWGKDAPASPTLFEYLRKSRRIPQNGAWFISSNKALTSRIGASSARDFGPDYGANVVFPKQLIIDAVVKAAAQGRAAHSANRAAMQPELEAMLEGGNYEGLGWSVSGDPFTLDASVRNSVSQAVNDLVHISSPATGDEFTYLVAVEIMRRFAPSLLVITFSDMEVAHFGSYSMHLAGIQTVDRLAYELWNEVQGSAAYREKTTLFILPEFGRDLDGSTTNGFFNHRQNNDSTRQTWMMCLGQGATPGAVVEHPVQHVDLCPTILRKFGVKAPQMQGEALAELLV